MDAYKCLGVFMVIVHTVSMQQCLGSCRLKALAQHDPKLNSHLSPPTWVLILIHIPLGLTQFFYPQNNIP